MSPLFQIRDYLKTIKRGISGFQTPDLNTNLTEFLETLLRIVSRVFPSKTKLLYSSIFSNLPNSRFSLILHVFETRSATVIVAVAILFWPIDTSAVEGESVKPPEPLEELTVTTNACVLVQELTSV